MTPASGCGVGPASAGVAPLRWRPLQLLVRDLDTGTVERLKLRAQHHGRSLQGELKAILLAAATFSMSEAGNVAEGRQRKLAGCVYTDSAEAIREDRER